VVSTAGKDDRSFVGESAYRLISHHICPYVQRARIVMQEKHIAYTVEYIDLGAPPAWFYEISPLEKVPVLMVGDEALFESMPICEYLDEVSPGSLYATDPLQRAHQRAWNAFGDDLLNRQFALLDAADELALKQVRAQLEDSFDILEETLGAGPFFAGHDFTMVDVVFAPIVRNFQVLESISGQTFLSSDFPQLLAWAEALLQRPSVRQAVDADFPKAYTAMVRRRGGHISTLLS